MVWSLALCPDDAKQDPEEYGVEFGVVFMMKGPRTSSVQEGLDCPDHHDSALEGERDFRLVVELPEVPSDAHPTCAGPPGDFNGQIRGFGHGAL